jgi:hypothetical protein
MPADPSAESVARRWAAHAREQATRRRWSWAVTATALSLLGFYVCLLLVIRVDHPFYLVVNLLAIATGLCNVIVYRVFEVPTILAELPRLSPDERRVNLAAIAPIRDELLGRVLPALNLVRRREQATALDDDALVARLAGVQRPDWRRIAGRALVAWALVATTVLTAVLVFRPEHGRSLLDRLTHAGD